MTNVGRPAKYKTVEDMQIAIDNYFNECDVKDKPYTICGLAYSLGFASRQSFFDYMENKSEFTDTIKRAKFKCEVQKSEDLLADKGNAAGKIFDLKNNFGWTDKNITEIQGGSVEININRKAVSKDKNIK